MRFPIAILILLVASAGCATTGAVLLEPATSGSVQRYAVAPDSLGAAAIRALAAGGLRTVRDTMQGDTRLIVGRGGPGFTSWGQFVRVAIIPGADLSEVRMLSRPAAALDFLHTNNTPRLYQALDRELRDVGIGPVAGDRVRVAVRAAPDRAITGRVLRPPGGGFPLVVETVDRVDSIPGTGVTRLEVYRGSYGQAKTGGAIGAVVGALAGVVIGASVDDEHGGLAPVAGLSLGSAAGFVAGAITGSLIHTQVWSELPNPR